MKKIPWQPQTPPPTTPRPLTGNAETSLIGNAETFTRIFRWLHVRCVAWYKLLKQTSFVCMSESRVYPQNLNNRSYIYTHAGDLPQWRALCLVRTSSQSNGEP